MMEYLPDFMVRIIMGKVGKLHYEYTRKIEVIRRAKID